MNSEKKLSQKESILSGVGWSYAARIMTQAITLLISIVLARILSPDHYGLISIVTVFITIGDALVVGGFGNALVQKKETEEIDFNSICWVSITVSFVVYCVLFLSAPLVSAFYSMPQLTPIIRVMGIKFVFSAFNSVQHAYVQKNMMFRKLFYSSVGGSVVSAAVGIAMALSGFGIWALVAQYISLSVINTLVLFCTIAWKPKLEISWKSVKQLWNYGAKVLGATMVFTIRDNIRTLLVGKRFSSADLAHYNQGQKYPSLLVTDIVASLGNVLFPLMSKNQSNVGRVKQLMRDAICVSSYILTPAVLGIFAVADTFVQVVLTEKWMPCVPFLRIMCLVYVTRSLSTVFQKSLLALGKSNLNLIHETLTSLTTIGLLFVAVFAFNSVILIAISQIAVMMLGVSLQMIWVRKYLGYGFREMARDYLPSAFMSIAMAVVVILIGTIPMPGLMKLVIQILAGVIIYVGLSVALKNPSFIKLKKLLMELINRNKAKI